MFYWDYKGKHIVLSDAEETQLVQELVGDPIQRVAYMTDKATRRRIEKLAFAYFKRLYREAPQEFYGRYYWRSLEGRQARKMFPVLLDAYTRAYRVAILGEFPPREEEPYTEKLQLAAASRIYGQEREPMWISVFSYSWLAFRRLRPKCQIAVDPTTITKLVGAVDHFVVSTDSLSIWFGSKRVRIFSYPLIPGK